MGWDGMGCVLTIVEMLSVSGWGRAAGAAKMGAARAAAAKILEKCIVWGGVDCG
jgi:hypothetical protein